MPTTYVTNGVTITEFFRSQAGTTSVNPKAERKFSLQGSDDPTVLQSAVGYFFGGTNVFNYGGWALVAQESEVVQSGNSLWQATLRYSLPSAQPRKTGESVLTFDTAGGKKTLYQAPSGSSSASYVSPSATTNTAVAADLHGVINGNETSVEGVELPVPQFAFSGTFYLSATNVTQSSIDKWYRLSGSINGASNTVTIDGIGLTFNAGELLYLDTKGSKRGLGDWEITQSYQGNPNLGTNTLKIGDITVTNKAGWQYLSTRYQQTNSGTNGVGGATNGLNLMIQKPVQVDIFDVYPSADLTQLGPWVT